MASKSSTKARRIGPHTYYVAGAAPSVISFAALPNEATIDVGKVTPVAVPNSDQSVKVMYWGADNDVPQYREQCITGNNIVPALIERKRNIICGQGWYAYREKFIDDGSGQMKADRDEVQMPPEAEAFFRKFKKTAKQIVGELLKHGMAMPEFVRFARDGQKIMSVKALKTKHIRAGKKNQDGDITTWYWGNYWPRDTRLDQVDRMIRDLPVYDEEAARKQGRFVLPLMDDLFDDEYYPIPPWWGGRHWITLSNIIPLFHEANLKNGAAPRFHIVIPHDFFYDYEAMNSTHTAEEKAALETEFQAREKAFVDDVTDVLTDVSKAGRIIVSKSELVEVMGKSYDKRIQIEEIKYDMRDEALLKLFEASNVANISAQAIHPTLANIETQGRLSSGTEIRNAFLMYLIIAAPAYRDLLMEVVDLVKKENGWPEDIQYAIRDAELTTLADNPAGVRPAETPIGK